MALEANPSPSLFVQTSHPTGSTHSANLPLQLDVVLDADTLRVDLASVQLELNSTVIPSKVSPTTLGVSVTAAWSLARNQAYAYTLRLRDTATPPNDYFYSATFTTDVRGSGGFCIEAEDFDYSKGESKSAANASDYPGLAYDGESASLGSDFGSDVLPADSQNSYRDGAASKVTLIYSDDLERNGFYLKGNWILYPSTNDWFQYTRHFPAGCYSIYAALSSDEFGPHKLFGRLFSVQTDSKNAPITQSLGVFDDEGTGGWGLNHLVALKSESDGSVVTLTISGKQTWRFQATSGAIDYWVLVPQATPCFTFVGIEDKTLVLRWSGSAVLQRGDTIQGPFTNVSPNSQGEARIPIDASGSSVGFFRLYSSTEYGSKGNGLNP